MFLEKYKHLQRHYIFTIFKGNFISKLVLVIGGLFLAKYYGAAAYGNFALYLSISSILAIVGNFAQEHLLILEADDAQVNRNFTASNILAVFWLPIFFLALLIPSTISRPVLILAIISGFLNLFTNNCKFLLAKKKLFTQISALTLTDSIGSFAFQVLFIFLPWQDGLIIGSFFGFLLAFVQGLYFTHRFFFRPNFQIYFKNLKQRRELLFFTYPSTLVNIISINLMPILLAIYFSKTLLGEYSLALKIISVPLLLISSSIATVYYPKAYDLFQNQTTKNELLNYTKRMSLINFAIVFVLFLIINLGGIPLLKIFFNKNWTNLGMFISIMSFGYIARALVNPVSDILTILRKNKVSLFFNLYLFLSNLSAVFIGAKFGITSLITVFSVMLFLGYGIMYLYILYLLKNEFVKKVY